MIMTLTMGFEARCLLVLPNNTVEVVSDYVYCTSAKVIRNGRYIFHVHGLYHRDIDGTWFHETRSATTGQYRPVYVSVKRLPKRVQTALLLAGEIP